MLSDFSVLIWLYEWKQQNTSAITMTRSSDISLPENSVSPLLLSSVPRTRLFHSSASYRAKGKHNDGYSVWSRWLLQCNVNIYVLPLALISVLSMHSIFGSFSSAYCLHATSPVYAICGNPSFDAFFFPWRMGLFCTLPFSKKYPLKAPLTSFQYLIIWSHLG